uniref:DUF5745 domain-containing protein n=1 Tax=Mucochytrium quahogii TaxID=96639 RepID=A0A7S2WBU4_9STRA|mmetsp:Transcript_41399/g.66516  ORF Transcript_41399/g.66516 Transcript_41399/m.66516 type:complete len:569 (-) Transcript_41399:14-1720(-)
MEMYTGSSNEGGEEEDAKQKRAGSPSKTSKLGTRLGKKREEQRDEDMTAKDDFHEAIVRRTNELFVKLNITTRPIQAFEELQKSASSMFVAIFETLFNVRLKNVIRKPRVVTDYITNAELVMTALSESLPVDLSYLSSEAIYRGEPKHIHHMLSIFESLWAQLFQGESGAYSGGEDYVWGSGDDETHSPPKVGRGSAKSPRQSPVQRSSTPFPGRKMDALPRKSRKKQPVTTKRKPPVFRQVGKPRTKTTAGGKRQLKKKKKKHPVINDENAHDMHNRIAQRKKQQGNLDPTVGSGKLQEAAGKLNTTIDDGPFVEGFQETGLASLEVLARQYPQIYKSLRQQRKKLEATVNQTERDAISKRFEKDLDRYTKAYSILSKGYEAELRKKSQDFKSAVIRAHKGNDLAKRIERAGSIRMKKDLQLLDKSRHLRRQNRDQVLARTLFTNEFKVEQDWILGKKKQYLEEKTQRNQERIDRYESIQRFYADRESMLKETLEQEQRDNKISGTARRIALKQLEVQLKNDYQAKLCRIKDEMDQTVERQFQKDEEAVNRTFEDIHERFSKFFFAI